MSLWLFPNRKASDWIHNKKASELEDRWKITGQSGMEKEKRVKTKAEQSISDICYKGKWKTCMSLASKERKKWSKSEELFKEFRSGRLSN